MLLLNSCHELGPDASLSSCLNRVCKSFGLDEQSSSMLSEYYGPRSHGPTVADSMLGPHITHTLEATPTLQWQYLLVCAGVRASN
jgi:hypothetical protein